MATPSDLFRLSDVTDILVPALAPGDTVLMDNLASHKVAGVCQLSTCRTSRSRPIGVKRAFLWMFIRSLPWG